MAKTIAKGLVACAASLTTMTVLAAGGAGGEIEKVDPNEHFHPKGKPPSEHTLKVLQEARDSMPFDDTRDFDEARKGFIAPLNSMIIEADAGHIAWDIERYEFLAAGEHVFFYGPTTNGLIALAVGAELLVQGAVQTGSAIGVPEAVIGLTVVAFGTSLPELSTCIAAARKQSVGLVLGNIIGSNTFNILSIVGLTALIKPLAIDPVLLGGLEIWAMVGVSVAFAL